MNTKIIYVLASGTIGAMVGYFTARHILERKYAEFADEKVEANRQAYEEEISELKGELKTLKTTDTEPEKTVEKETPVSHAPSNAKVFAYNRAFQAYDEDDIEDEDVNVTDEPYLISPAEFGEHLDYRQITLGYFYKDDILADEDGHKVPFENIGAESLSHFGDYEADSIHVRNPKLKCDFEVLIDDRVYADCYECGGD